MMYSAGAMPIDAASSLRFDPIGPNADRSDSDRISEGFSSFLESSMSRVNDAQLHADRVSEDFLMGGDVPVHTVMMEMAKADTTMRLATSVIQKVIDAYMDVSRMQI